MAYVLLLENFGKKIYSKQVVECDCKLPSLLSLIPVQSSWKRAQNNIATNPGEFQKLGTKRYQSDKLSFDFKITILESLILNSRTKSDSPAVLSERFPSECLRSVCVCGAALEPFPAGARSGLSAEVWHTVLGCCAVFTRGRALSAQCHWSCSPRGTPEHAEGKGALSVQSWASSAVSLLLLLPFLPSPECDSSSTIKLPHSQPTVSPSAAGACYWGMDYFQKSIAIWEHISFLCAGSWVKKTLTPRWLPVLLNSVLIQPLPLQPFRTSVSSSRSLLVLMSCVFAISSFIPLLWLSFPI